MLALAIETVALVFATAFVGLAAGFCAGALVVLISAGRSAAQELHAEPEEVIAAQPQPVRRIPDPAPPSELRRRRLLTDQPKPNSDVSS
ncbi:MAG: hypothetical protein AAGF81_12945 [Pseudomonadota bacterium]